MKYASTWHVIIGCLALVVAGCAPTPPTAADRGYPPDFSLVFTVEHDAAAANDPDPLHRPAQHVVAPDRTLRVALGRDVGHDYHPDITARLAPQQMVELYRLAEGGNLLEPPDEPAADLASEAVRYRLTITASGYRRTYVTTPERRPAATMLLRRLVELRQRP